MVGSLVGVPEQPVGLNLICSTINEGCMGLPQELVDHIVDTLHEDLPALKACSLTCKAMFASTRHLIHQTLCLTPRNNERVLTRGGGEAPPPEAGIPGRSTPLLILCG